MNSGASSSLGFPRFSDDDKRSPKRGVVIGVGIIDHCQPSYPLFKESGMKPPMLWAYSPDLTFIRSDSLAAGGPTPVIAAERHGLEESAARSTNTF